MQLKSNGIRPTQTVAREIEIAGSGIHSGADCRVRILPADGGQGITFCRPGEQPLKASWGTASAEESNRRTVILNGTGQRFEQVEHLMAAFAALGISDATVEQEGPEVPFLDGGSQVYFDRLREAGLKESGRQRPILEVSRPVALKEDGALLVATPHDGLRLSAYVEFPGTIVGCAGYTAEITADVFRREIAPARTFAHAADLEKLRAGGLIKGGNLDNAVVFDHERYYNSALNFPDEVVRHKIIDLLGDLALLGCCLNGHFWGWRSGHRSHVRFAQHLAREFLRES